MESLPIEQALLQEHHLQSRASEICKRLDLTLEHGQHTIGRFALDCVARDQHGNLALLEFKVNKWVGSIGQLLLYRRALIKQKSDCTLNRCILVTTYLDFGVVDIMEKISPVIPNLEAHVFFLTPGENSGFGLRRVTAKDNSYEINQFVSDQAD